MKERILVTGGAGFIGSFLVDQLVREGYAVRILDCLDTQVHPSGQWPTHKNAEAEYIRGDVRDLDAVKAAVRDVSVIFHEAAAVGVSQSQQQVKHYAEANIAGSATLYQALIDTSAQPRRIVVAGSMSSYGEGTYRCDKCGPRRPARQADLLAKDQWNPPCPTCGGKLAPVPITEEDPAIPASIYALSKKGQEDFALNMAATYGWPTVVLRYFNAYGPRQALSNPYTGVLAIFINRLLNDLSPLVYEDGAQLRDFVSVHDIIDANLLAMTCELPKGSTGELFNIGSGEPLTVCEVGRLLAERMQKSNEPEITRKYRVGDVRHCFADISKARRLLKYNPRRSLANEVFDLIQWARQTPRHADKLDRVVEQFAAQGLVR